MPAPTMGTDHQAPENQQLNPSASSQTDQVDGLPAAHGAPPVCAGDVSATALQN